MASNLFSQQKQTPRKWKDPIETAIDLLRVKKPEETPQEVVTPNPQTITKPSVTPPPVETPKPKHVVLPKLPTGNLIVNGQEVTQAENDRQNRRANSQIGIREAFQQRQEQAIAQQNANMPLVQPPPIDTNTNLPKADFLDVGKVLGGATGGATAGALIAGPVGAVVGGIGGAATAFFFSQQGEQKQFTKTQYADFTQSTKNVEKIMNNANARMGSPQQNRLYMENELARIEQVRTNLEKQSQALFGEKLSANQDERAKIEAWIRMWNIYGSNEFNLALQNPNPQFINQNIAVQDELTQ